MKLKIAERLIKSIKKKVGLLCCSIKCAPSILAADYANFESELKRIEETGVKYVHIDIMDGQFVPSISFGAGVVASMRKHSKLVFDCHLMVVNPERYVDDFSQAGADIMTVHVEATIIFTVPFKNHQGCWYEGRYCHQSWNTSC